MAVENQAFVPVHLRCSPDVEEDVPPSEEKPGGTTTKRSAGRSLSEPQPDRYESASVLQLGVRVSCPNRRMIMLIISLTVMAAFTQTLSASDSCSEELAGLREQEKLLKSQLQKQELLLRRLQLLNQHGDTNKPRASEVQDTQHTDCSQIFSSGSKSSGLYGIKPHGSPSPVKVYCDMTEGGGWTVLQRRINGAETFNRSWAEYRDGFGDMNAEFWLGNNNLHHITAQGNYSLRFNLEDFDGNQRYAEYQNVKVADEKKPITYASDKSKISYVIGLLEGKALSWAEAAFERHSFRHMSYTAFMDEMKKVFDHPARGGDAVKRLINLRQGNMSVAEFAVDFRTAAADSGWNDQALCGIFTNGLSSRLKEELATRDAPESLNDLVSLSIRLDNRLRERDRERQTRPELSLPGSTVRTVRPSLPSTTQSEEHHAAGPSSSVHGGTTEEEGHGSLFLLWKTWTPESCLPRTAKRSGSSLAAEVLTTTTAKDHYRLTFGAYVGTAGDAMSGGHQVGVSAWASHHAMKFSTYDQDNDNYKENCAKEDKGGWWFNKCHSAHLNGLYYPNGHYSASTDDGVVWYPWRGWWYSLKTTIMKLRPTDFKMDPTTDPNAISHTPPS